MDGGKILFSWVLVLIFYVVEKPCFALPDTVTQLMYCVGCQSTVIQMNRMIRKPQFDGLEERVTDVMDKICNEKSFANYATVPPKMIKTCKYLIEMHGDEIESIFMKEYETGASDPKAQEDRIVDKICKTLSSACDKPDELEDEVDEIGKKGVVDYDEEKQTFKLKVADSLNKPDEL